ncbi:MAG: peptidylprolyl isomerase [Candidatus Daviesbacteria bacterium]|nr:peptidylprolyl isomerase [Candidatus Daviesbacteria bacterium]
MFTNQKVLGILLIVFIIGTAIYFTVTKFSRDVSNLSATPTPVPQDINFTLNSTPAPSAANVAQTQQTQSTELPLAKNKRLDRFPGILRPEVLQNKKAVIQTSKGLIQLQIYPEASMAASNFMLLAANGFYDGLIFHRVEDWVVQGGDPTGIGSGGPGYEFPDESVTRAYVKGIVAMANSGPNTNGSQFFILKKDVSLQPNYTIFGQIISGEDIVEKLIIGDVMQKVVIQNLQ